MDDWTASGNFGDFPKPAITSNSQSDWQGVQRWERMQGLSILQSAAFITLVCLHEKRTLMTGFSHHFPSSWEKTNVQTYQSFFLTFKAWVVWEWCHIDKWQISLNVIVCSDNSIQQHLQLWYESTSLSSVSSIRFITIHLKYRNVNSVSTVRLKAEMSLGPFWGAIVM